MRIDVYNEVKKLKELDLKLNKSELARRLNCDRRTVAKYLADDSLPVKKMQKKESKLDAFKDIVAEKVDQYGTTAMAAYAFIKNKGYTGGYGLVKNFIHAHKNEAIKKATIRFETIPGLQAQVDWKESLKMINTSAEVFEVNIFLMVLGYSRYKFLKLTTNKTQNTLFECLNKAFQHYGGVPQEILFDNMATVVDRAASRLNNVKLNTTFQQYAKDAAFKPLVCRPYRPQTKGKVEAVAKLMNRLAPYNGEFETFEELEAIVEQMNYDMNREICQATGEIPNEQLKKEQEYLLPLPAGALLESYVSSAKEYKVSKESMVTYKGKKYSVPTHFIGKQVHIKEQADEIQIYYTSNLITSHAKSKNFLNYKREHVHEILKSDSFRYKTDDEIAAYIEANLLQYDKLL